METWPLSLPERPERSFSRSIISGNSGVSDSNEEKRFDTYPKYSVRFDFKRFSLQEVTVLREFYKETLNEVNDFTVPWLDMAGFADSYCNFESPPSAKETNGVWSVSINLVISKHVPMVNGEITYGEM